MKVIFGMHSSLNQTRLTMKREKKMRSQDWGMMPFYFTYLLFKNETLSNPFVQKFSEKYVGFIEYENKTNCDKIMQPIEICKAT